jgi:hypothetical protein
MRRRRPQARRGTKAAPHQTTQVVPTEVPRHRRRHSTPYVPVDRSELAGPQAHPRVVVRPWLRRRLNRFRQRQRALAHRSSSRPTAARRRRVHDHGDRRAAVDRGLHKRDAIRLRQADRPAGEGRVVPRALRRDLAPRSSRGTLDHVGPGADRRQPRRSVRERLGRQRCLADGPSCSSASPAGGAGPTRRAARSLLASPSW